VLTRLLENTFDYNANGGNVRLLVTEQKRESNRTTLRFAISDSSTGVNAEYLSSIFEPIDPKVIVQVDSPDQLDLGLTLAKSNVAAMGGRVEAQSLDDQGSCVTVTMTFPISYDRNETFTRLPAEAGRKFTFKGGRVLLVDDHKISLEIGVKMLEKVGLDVDTAMNGEEALDAFRKAGGKYDLILMDIQMPLVDGLEATRMIRNEKELGGEQVPIIAMTANAFEEDVKGSFAAGMNEHLTKPFSPQELYTVMSKFIG
jgi:CheY-like chemotaxis protein